MAKEYLDKAGLSYLWGKLKTYFQEKLVSGTNIKTINNQSVLGSGNLTVGGGGIQNLVDGSATGSVRGIGAFAESSSYTMGDYAFAEGSDTKAIGDSSHAEGYNTTAGEDFSHAEGVDTTTTGTASHAEGTATTASGDSSHAEGDSTTASGGASHAGGSNTIAGYDNQTVIGKYNDNKSTSLFEIGNGNSSARSNAFEVDTSGNTNIAAGAKYKINGTALSASDVDAVPTSRTVNSKALSSNITLSASDVGAVPTTRTVNSKALSSNITLSASDVGALPITGGNITGNLSYKSSSIDASLANNGVSSTQYPTTFNILDKSNRILTRKEAAVESNGNISAYWYVRNYNTSGTRVGQKGIKITMNKSGAVTYAVDEPDKFLSAISAVPKSRTVNGNALSADITLKATDFFIFDTYSKKVTVPGSGAYNFTMGALTQHSGYTLRGYINQNGGYTDQWLASYGTYGPNVVAMIYSKYGASLTSTISCVAVWTKN